MNKAIYFDMDGTIANLYGQEDWLTNLINEKTKPYREAKPLVNMRQLGRELNRLQALGYHVGIISWTCKNATSEYDERVAKTKINWLKKHISAVNWNEISIVKYGTPKYKIVNKSKGILFDDEVKNRQEWNDNNGMAFDVDNIIEVLKSVA
jgi:hypothetical protein